MKKVVGFLIFGLNLLFANNALGKQSQNYDDQGTPERKEINFYTNKKNLGFLYNIGAKKYIGVNPFSLDLSVVDSSSAPLPISIVTSFDERFGSYQEIVYIGSIRNPNLGTKNSSDYHSGIMRFDAGGYPNNTRYYLYGLTSPYNKLVVTPPYYKNSSAFKVRRKDKCMGVDRRNRLMDMPCVDDRTDGTGKDEENDRQLFIFCREDSADKCNLI